MATASPSSSELSSPPASDVEIHGFKPKCRPRDSRVEDTPVSKPSHEGVIVAACPVKPEGPQDHDSITVALSHIFAASPAKAATPPPLEITVELGKEASPPATLTLDIHPPEATEAAEPSFDVGGPSVSLCSSSRPKRKREVRVQPPTAAPTLVAKKGTIPAPKRHKKQWEPPFVYTSPNSPLVKRNIDLRAMLCNPLAWDGLSSDQQQSLIPLFPPGFILDKGTPQARPNIQAMLNSDDFRHDCAQYLTNMRLGRHEPEWILQAQEAHFKRKNGDFDGFLRKRFRDDWGVEAPTGYPEPKRAEALLAEKHKLKKVEDKAEQSSIHEEKWMENDGNWEPQRNSGMYMADEPMKPPHQKTKQQQQQKQHHQQQQQLQKTSIDKKFGKPQDSSTTEPPVV